MQKTGMDNTSKVPRQSGIDGRVGQKANRILQPQKTKEGKKGGRRNRKIDHYGIFRLFSFLSAIP